VSRVLVSDLRSLPGKEVRVVEIAAHINDEECARTAVQELRKPFQQTA
jgi:hypothetical protein